MFVKNANSRKAREILRAIVYQTLSVTVDDSETTITRHDARRKLIRFVFGMHMRSVKNWCD